MVQREGGSDRWIFLGMNNDYAMSRNDESDDESDDDTPATQHTITMTS
jgi:hypothetical protein